MVLYLGGGVAALGVALGLFTLWNHLTQDADAIKTALGVGGAILLVASGVVTTILSAHPSKSVHWATGGVCGLALGLFAGGWGMHSWLTAIWNQAMLELARGNSTVEAATALPPENEP